MKAVQQAIAVKFKNEIIISQFEYRKFRYSFTIPYFCFKQLTEINNYLKTTHLRIAQNTVTLPNSLLK